MERCPHCAAPLSGNPTCRTCGLPLGAPVAVERLPDVEQTRFQPLPEVPSQRLEGLETTEEVLGDTRIPDDEEEEAAPAAKLQAQAPAPAKPVVCRRCGTPAGAGRFCERCGMAVLPAGRVTDAPKESTVRCRACGVPNALGREVCCGCGMRL